MKRYISISSSSIITCLFQTQPDGKPDDQGNLQNQVRMYKKGFWDDSYSFNKHPYACDYRGTWQNFFDVTHHIRT